MPTAMGRKQTSWTIRPSIPYSLQLTALSHGWVNLPPYDWDASNATLKRIEYLPVIQKTLCISVAQTPNGELRIMLAGQSVPRDGRIAWNELAPRLSRALSLQEDLASLRGLAHRYDKKVLALLEAGGGRLLRGTTFFEDVVKTLLTTNASWEFTKIMVRNLISLFGHQGSFPAPEDFEGVSEVVLRREARIGYRARYLRSIVDTFRDAGTDDLPPNTKFLGLADYGAAHANVLRGDYSKIPLDSEVRSYCRELHGCEIDAQILERYSKWGPFAFLGYKLARQARKKNWIGEPKNNRITLPVASETVSAPRASVSRDGRRRQGSS